VVADHSKWGVISNFEVAKIDEAQMLVTDNKFSESARAELEVRNVKVIVADESAANSRRGGRSGVHELSVGP
jgi:DeoR/GlpR family transcriptional regulator of sugar metabolism